MLVIIEEKKDETSNYMIIEGKKKKRSSYNVLTGISLLKIFQLSHIVLCSYQSVQCVCVCVPLLHSYA